MKSKISSVLLWGLVLALTFSVGFFSGRSNTAEASFTQSSGLETGLSKIPTFIIGHDGTKPKTVNDSDFELFWKAWNLLDKKFVDIHSTSTPTTTKAQINKARVLGAIKGMVASQGDPYTVFFEPEEAAAFESQIEGNFEGVGMEMGIKDGSLTVIAALKNTPAEKAGMKSGDKVLKIDASLTADMSVDQAIKLIRGKKGTAVTLLISRDGIQAPFEIKIIRDVINIPTLDTKYDSQTGIFTIRLYSFSAQSSTLFRNALRDFVATGSNKLILDLRGNPGGYLDAAVDMASWFLPAGKIVVKEDYGKNSEGVNEVSKGYNIFSDNLRMIILVDGGSASASEILAGALSEYNKATLVGSQTFGKGSVQEFTKLDSNAAIKITVAKWLTPNGVSISAAGLKPKYDVKVTPEDVKNGKDLQMEKAIELLR